ncbi:TPA: ISLre2 family transposase [Streptococcus agalactiae]
MFDEREFKEKLFAQNETNFYEFVSKYDERMVPVMKSRGYKCIHTMERTVVFTFGEFTFRRRRWKKGDKWVVPVDEKLGLKKHVRFSWEFMYQIALLSTMMPYDKVVQTVNIVYRIVITKPTVVKAVKLCQKLLEEREAYRFLETGTSIDKKPAEVIYIEGDGVMVKARGKELDNRNVDLSHFVIHTGSKKVRKNRFELQSKKEFIALNNRLSREKVLDYLYNHFIIDENTLLITNSDGGHGYTPYVFKEISKALKVKRHEHFWDKYHVDQHVKSFFKIYPAELLDKTFKAIDQHDKGKLRTTLDTTEALVSTKEELEGFQKFKRKLLNNFHYTKPAKLRDITRAQGIGVMESQHRKITYRMKKRGMYWSVEGANTMSQMIILAYEGELRNLFFGSWRDDYHFISDLEGSSAGKIKVKQNQIAKNYDLQALGSLNYGRYKNI